MPFSEQEKAELRRLCGYPARGAFLGNSQPWLQLAGAELLEFRINNLSDPEMAISRRYLGTLLALEIAIPKSADNLDTDQAAVWTRNREEYRDRVRLFDDWRRRLCGFLGVGPGPSLRSPGLSLVV